MLVKNDFDLPYWTECCNPENFDTTLASFSGHPLQSVLWGNARQKIDGIGQVLIEYRAKNEEILGLARIEKRVIPFIGQIAWVPKGPVLLNQQDQIAKDSLYLELKKRGFIACITDLYSVIAKPKLQSPKTIWIDLKQGLDTLYKRLDSRVRYSTRLAQREGVVIRKTDNPTEVSKFFHLCNLLSKQKGFSLPGSEPLFLELIKTSSLQNNKVSMSLFIAEIHKVIIGGAIIARSGRNMHYLWGASDRHYSRYRVSEAIQWEIIQDGVLLGIERYDLEGIDPIKNPSVYQFKQKLGGTEVSLQGMEVTSFSWIGKSIVNIGRCLEKILK